MTDLLFVTPNERGTPRALAPVSQALQSRVRPGDSVTELHDRAVNRGALDGALQAILHVLYFGHGQRDHLGESQPLADHQNLTSDHVLIAIACHAGAGLGPAVFPSTAKGGFVGFDAVVVHPRKATARANTAYENSLATFLGGQPIADLRVTLEAELLGAANDYLTNAPAYRISPMEGLIFFASLRSNTVALVQHGNPAATV